MRRALGILIAALSLCGSAQAQQVLSGPSSGGGGGGGTPGGTNGQIQYNNGGAFGGLTIGSGLSSSGGTLSATGGAPTYVVTNTYTSSGAIAVTDTTSLLNSASSLAMRLANGTVDGHSIAIPNIGAGTATVTLSSLDGTPSVPIQLPSGSVLNVAWNAVNSTYIVIN